MAPRLSESEQQVLARLHQETARIPWRELQRFFASGATIAVDPALDLLEVAGQLAGDEAGRVARWLEQGRLCRVSDEQALAWLEADATVWAVVVAPWVLVQEI